MRGACLAAAAVAMGLAFPPRGLAAESAAAEALRLSAEGRYEEALPRFEAAAREEPKNHTLQLGLGLACQKLGRYPDAVRALERAAALAPQAPEPRYSLALLYEAEALGPSAAEEPKGGAPDGVGTKSGPAAGAAGAAGASAASPGGESRKSLLKARRAWEAYLRLEKDPRRLEAGREHLSRLLELLSP